MPFSEYVKKIVREKAAYRCCRCQQVGVEIHHIIPEKEDGKDDIDNAAPLCAKCHADFGDNPTKRKELREMRDWWYRQAATMFKIVPDYAPVYEKVDALISEIRQQHDTKIDDLKTTLTEVVKKNYDHLMKTITSITPSSSAADATTILNTMSSWLMKQTFFTGTCKQCGSYYAYSSAEPLDYDPGLCPKCLSAGL